MLAVVALGLHYLGLALGFDIEVTIEIAREMDHSGRELVYSGMHKAISIMQSAFHDPREMLIPRDSSMIQSGVVNKEQF